MIATHGFLQLNKDKKLAFTNSTVNEDIVYVISPTCTDIIPAHMLKLAMEYGIFPKSLGSTITVDSNITPPTNPTLRTHSIGFMLMNAFRHRVNKHESITFSHVYLERVRHEVIKVELRYYDYEEDITTVNYVIVNSDGFFIMPLDEDGYGYRLNEFDDIAYISGILRGDIDYSKMVYFTDPVAPTKTPREYSDVSIMTMDD